MTKKTTKAQDFIKFKPVPGYTFQFAIREAIQLAEMNDKLVKLEVNDVVLDITKKTDFVKAIRLYEKLSREL